VNVRYSELPDSSVRRGVHLVCGILGKVGPDREVVRFDASFDDSHVSTAGAVILELILKPFLCLEGLRENEKTGRLTIQPMDDEEFFRSSLVIQIGA